MLNQGIVWDPVTGAGERYSKRNPVAATASTSRSATNARRFLTAGPARRIGRDMLPGPATSRSIAGVPVADAICFDVAYDEGIYDQVENGAQLLTVQTSNASFIFTDQVDQQFAITRLAGRRDRPRLVVAATNGISGGRSPPTARWSTAAQRRPACSSRRRSTSKRGHARRSGRPWPAVAARADLVGLLLAPAAASPSVASTTNPRAATPADERTGATKRTPRPSAGTVRDGRPDLQRGGEPRLGRGALRRAQPAVEVLVVDDDSPDGTGDIADELAAADPGVHVLHRAAKGGLGGAYLQGFARALGRGLRRHR